MKENIDLIKSIVVDSVETEFHVMIKSDDGGYHYCIYLPWNTSVKKLRDEISNLELQKRCLIVFSPSGYIETFLRK
jgi:hypothetical protein